MHSLALALDQFLLHLGHHLLVLLAELEVGVQVDELAVLRGPDGNLMSHLGVQDYRQDLGQGCAGLGLGVGQEGAPVVADGLQGVAGT